MRKKSEERDTRLRYFVSVTYDDLIKSGEIQTEHIGHFGTSAYGIIRADIHSHKDNIGVSLFNEFMMEPSVHVEKAYLLKYEGNKLIGEEEFENHGPEEEWTRHFHMNQIKKYENMRLAVKVVYSNGETFEKEVLID